LRRAFRFQKLLQSVNGGTFVAKMPFALLPGHAAL
jgi:hypothetical protein